MTLFQRVRHGSVLKWASSIFVHNLQKSPIWKMEAFLVVQNPRFFGTEGSVPTETLNKGSAVRFSRAARREAQAALLEYFFCTRALPFRDAENMSKNSPIFFESLLGKVEPEDDVGMSIRRFLRYHPINEFEPFFESLGLKPSEYRHLLHQDNLFLSDDTLLLENYQVLCDYGVEQNKLGKICKEAMQVFRYESGVLSSKLTAYEELGLDKSFIKKAIVCSPSILIGDIDTDFIEALQTLKDLGFEHSWVEEHLLELKSYNWSIILQVLRLFRKIGCDREQLHGLISRQPGLILEDSGYKMLSVAGFLLKFGSTLPQICAIFLQFPQIPVGEFVSNMNRCILLLNEIEMNANEIGKIVRGHFLMLGKSTLKRTNSLYAHLNVGKKRLREYIQENPQELSKWVVGAKIKPLPPAGGRKQSKIVKTEFLVNLGYEDDPAKIAEACKFFRGRAAELQERFDCLVNAGLDEKDVSEMVRVSPQILNQSKKVLQRKIDVLVNELGYPVTTLVPFPSYLSYTPERVKLRLSMYDWLGNEGKVEPLRALSTIVACSSKTFMKKYVIRYSGGPQVWEDLKQRIYSAA